MGRREYSKIDVPHCAGGVPASRAAMAAIAYFERIRTPIFIATAETWEYANSYRQQRFLHDVGFSGNSIRNLYTADVEYDMKARDGNKVKKRAMLSRILRRERAHPSRVLFIDDVAENRSHARSLGIKTIGVPTRYVRGKRYSRGMTYAEFREAREFQPKVVIFDIDGTITDEATCEELYPGRLGY